MHAVVAVALLSLLGQAPTAHLEAARDLAPLLRGIERRLPAEVTVRPDTLPPSPFTGSRATLFAFRVAKDRPVLDQATERAIRDLLAWEANPDAHPATTPLAAAWVTHLQAQMEAASEGIGETAACALDCTVSRMQQPGDLFGANPRERQEARDLMLMDALATAVADPATPR